MAKVTVWRSKFVRGWNGDAAEDVETHPMVDLEEALLEGYVTDAHFVPYTAVVETCPEGRIPRINKLALVADNAPTLQFEVLVYDVDCPAAHRDGGSATADWRVEQSALREALPWRETMGWYETRGGYRMLWLLESPVDESEYIALLNGFRVELQAHGIECDELVDWTRCYRLPFVTRDGVAQDLEHDLSWLSVLQWTPPAGAQARNVFDGIENVRGPLIVPERIEAGGRNTMLTRVAGGFRRTGMEFEEIVQALDVLNQTRCDPPMERADIERIARSVARYDPAPEEIGGGGGMAHNGPRFVLGSEVEYADAVCDEMETGERMVFDRERLWQYSGNTGVWREVKPVRVYNTMAGFDGEPVIVGREADGTPRTRPLKVSNRLTEDVNKLVGKRRTVQGFLDESVQGLAFSNGFIRIEGESLKLEPFSAGHRALHGLSFDYVPDCEPGRFIRMLESCFHGDEDIAQKVGLVQEFIGVCLLGMATTYQKGLMLVGDGANGKSTFQTVVSSLFRNEGMVTAVPPQEMDQEYRRAMLSRSLLNVVNELPEADILSSEAVKAMISGDLVVGRYIRQAPFEFRPRAGHLFSANNLPGVRDMSRGFWRRWLVLEFRREFAEHEQDRWLAARIIKHELPDIASWSIDGAARVVKNGSYSKVASSEEAVNQWRMVADQVALFSEQKCDPDGAEWTSAESLYSSYCLWASQNNHSHLSGTKFGRRLRALGVEKKRKADGIHYFLCLKKTLFAVK
jgi:P4 family phage/plasmid primase-like protien